MNVSYRNRSRLLRAKLFALFAGPVFMLACASSGPETSRPGKPGVNSSTGKKANAGNRSQKEKNREADKNRKAGKDREKNKKSESTGGRESGPEQKNSAISKEERAGGFVSARLFRVFVVAFGSSPEEARRAGLREGKRKALNMMRRKRARSGSPLSSRALRELRRAINENTRIHKIRKEKEGVWNLVLFVEKDRLRGYLRRLR